MNDSGDLETTELFKLQMPSGHNWMISEGIRVTPLQQSAQLRLLSTFPFDTKKYKFLFNETTSQDDTEEVCPSSLVPH